MYSLLIKDKGMLGSVELRLFASLTPVMGGKLFDQYDVTESLLNKSFLRLNEDLS